MNVKLQLLLSVCCLLFLSAAAEAAVFEVDTTSGATIAVCSTAPADCSLRGAIALANTNNESDSVIFDQTVFNGNQTIEINGDGEIGEILIQANNDSLAVDGGGRVTISADSLSGVFITNGDFNIRNLIITRGFNQTGGAAIVNAGAGFLSASQIYFLDNRTNGTGGALLSTGGGSGVVRNSAFAQNTAVLGGAVGLSNFGSITIINSTIANNTASTSGGGIYVEAQSTISVAASTIALNTAQTSGGGLFADGGLNLDNTIIADNTAPVSPDGGGTGVKNSGGFNIIGNTAGFNIAPATGDKFNTDPQLSPQGLANNGGPTPTIALQRASPAIDAGNSTFATDQRLLPRPVDLTVNPNSPGSNGSDIGAFESQAPTAAPAAISGRVISGKRGISRAFLVLIGDDSTAYYARTNQFGYFRFENLPVGTYLLSVYSKNNDPVSQAINLTSPIEITINAKNSASRRNAVNGKLTEPK